MNPRRWHCALRLLGLVLASCSASATPAHESPSSSARDAAANGGGGAHGGASAARDAAVDAAAFITIGRADASTAVGDASQQAGPTCQGAGHCVQLCQGGVCSCHCDCRSDAQCGGSQLDGQICVPVTEPAPPCCGTRPMCSNDTECSPGQQGQAFICSGAGCGLCRPACTNDSFCGDGLACRSSGHCAPKGCKTDGYTCPAHSHCDENGANVDQHGCAHDACATDKDCQEGACVNGRCYDSPGRCAPTRCG
jgi:hypothetical protein